MYYVYQHRKADTNADSYVGKGAGDRAYKERSRNDYWKRIVAKHGYKVAFIAKDLTEELAFLVEAETINLYKRLNIKLSNMTDGGEGASGYRHTEQHKQKMVGNQYGKLVKQNGFKGKTHSDEQKAKWSETRKGVTSPRKGVTLSDETRSKISQSRMGIVVQKRRALSDEQVREIRVLLPQHSIAALARKYGVGESTIRRLRDGERYAEVK